MILFKRKGKTRGSNKINIKGVGGIPDKVAAILQTKWNEMNFKLSGFWNISFIKIIPSCLLFFEMLPLKGKSLAE